MVMAILSERNHNPTYRRRIYDPEASMYLTAYSTLFSAESTGVYRHQISSAAMAIMLRTPNATEKEYRPAIIPVNAGLIDAPAPCISITTL